MHKSDFHYDLPPDLIAQRPVAVRSSSRLLYLDAAGSLPSDQQFSNFPTLLRNDDLLVFNDTRVIPARLFGAKMTGGRVEVLVQRLLDAHCVEAMLRVSKPPKVGQTLQLDGGHRARVQAVRDGFFELCFESEMPVAAILEQSGHVPLPPYIDRADTAADRERYQTVYAREPGAVAAPTAGLHFDEAMLARLSMQGIESVSLTLHVGAGTFQPIRCDDPREHCMHAEWMRLDATVADRINRAKQQGRRIVAVGTTSVRALECAARDGGTLAPFEGETAIFIYPPYRFRIVDALLTNFHLPESTLLMLVCALGGTARVLAAYRHAVEKRYRFYSYGDAMLVERAKAT